MNSLPSDHPDVHQFLGGSIQKHLGILKYICVYTHTHKHVYISWAYQYMPVIPELWRLRQEEHKFEANLDYIVC